MIDPIDQMMLKEYNEDAKELGLTLQEYLLFRVLRQMDDLKVTTYSGD